MLLFRGPRMNTAKSINNVFRLLEAQLVYSRSFIGCSEEKKERSEALTRREKRERAGVQPTRKEKNSALDAFYIYVCIYLIIDEKPQKKKKRKKIKRNNKIANM